MTIELEGRAAHHTGVSPDIGEVTAVKLTHAGINEVLVLLTRHRQ